MPTLEWIGKDKVINHHQEVPYRILDKKYTYNADSSENMIIHGDNLLALKSLLPEYEGRVDCIYIDPPYNTGNEKWVYNDNVNDPKIKKWLGEVVGQEGEDLSRHDKWLCMMYPRLKLLNRLLADNGVIFISIGQEEIDNLLILCNEIFGCSNRLGVVTRVAKTASNKGTFFAPSIDYVVVYAKNKPLVENFRGDVDESLYKKIETQGEMKGLRYRDDVALYQSALDPLRGCVNQRYFIQAPDGSFLIPPGNSFPLDRKDAAFIAPKTKEDKVWRWSYQTYLQNKALLVFKKTKTSPLLDENGLQAKYNIYTKSYLDLRKSTGTVPRDYWDHCINRKGADLLKRIGINFDFSKPIELLSYILRILGNPQNCLILDSFAGSGTTAHAVLDLNKQDGGNRKFILVEMMDYADTITAERVKRVIDGYGEGNKAVAGLGGDFSYYELGEPLFKEDKNLNEEVGEEEIRKYVYYMETKLPLEVGADDNRYYMGKANDTAYYFYYEKNKPTTLNREFLSTVKTKASGYLIYADVCALPKETLDKNGIVFKKIPRDIKKL